jgi:hypothetical protein
MVNSNMLQKLYEINIKISLGNTKIKRKEIQLLVDSCIEQVWHYYFKMKPKGIPENARLFLNTHLSSFTTEEDRVVLRGLLLLLKSYTIAFSKEYTDHTESFESFLNEELKKFALALVRHSFFRDDENAQILRGLLE